MQSPTTWNDKALLLQEPFLTEFVTRATAIESRKRKGNCDWNDRIAKEIKKSPECLKAYSDWVNIVFQEPGAESKNTGRPVTISTEPSMDQVHLKLFIEVLWLVYMNREQEAQNVLKDARKAKGHIYALNPNASKRSNSKKSSRDNTRRAPVGCDARLQLTSSRLSATNDTCNAHISENELTDPAASHNDGRFLSASQSSIVDGASASTSSLIGDIKASSYSSSATNVIDSDTDLNSTCSETVLMASRLPSEPIHQQVGAQLNASLPARTSGNTIEVSMRSSGLLPQSSSFECLAITSEIAQIPHKISDPLEKDSFQTYANAFDDNPPLPAPGFSKNSSTVSVRSAYVAAQPFLQSEQVSNGVNDGTVSLRVEEYRQGGSTQILSRRNTRDRKVHATTSAAQKGRANVKKRLPSGNTSSRSANVSPHRSGGAIITRGPGAAITDTITMISGTVSTTRTSKTCDEKASHELSPKATRKRAAPSIPEAQMSQDTNKTKGVVHSYVRPARKRRRSGQECMTDGNLSHCASNGKTIPHRPQRSLEEGPCHGARLLEGSPAFTNTQVGLATSTPRKRHPSHIDQMSQNKKTLVAQRGHSQHNPDQRLKQRPCIIYDQVPDAIPRKRQADEQSTPLPLEYKEPIRWNGVTTDWEEDCGSQGHSTDTFDSSDDESVFNIILGVSVSHDGHSPVLCQTDVGPVKTPLPGNAQPLIWAESRQSLCESFRWFRSYQSGVYHSKGIVKGYLLSAFSSARDVFHHGGKLIISHGGGKSQILKYADGQTTTIAEDQSHSDKSVRALLHSYTTKSPIVLIADDKYRLFPYDLGKFTYVILGYYWVTNAWAELETSMNDRGFCVKYKFAFQWCESQGRPWWFGTSNKCSSLVCQAPGRDPERQSNIALSLVIDDKRDADPDKNRPLDCMRACSACGIESPAVYERGWMCLIPSCKAFWQCSENCLSHDNLVYSSSFLALRATPSSLQSLKKIRLNAPIKNIKDGITTNKEFCRGWWCDRCGRLCSREKWEFWHCANCENVYQVNSRVREPKEFWSQEDHLKCMHHTIHERSGITFSLNHWEDSGCSAERNDLTLNSFGGRIHLILGSALANRRADNLFRLYQNEATSGPFFQRYPLQSHPLRGRMLANYFSQNSGAPYKYVAGTGNTVPFESAPSAVTGALQLIKERAALVLGGKIENFNEVLSCAYMERQKMSFHSDSEPGLGPVVSSLSLGSIAMMHFRLQSAYIPPGCQRHRHLTLVLRHGDVLVMEGAQIQTMYEHSVIPKNFRIAATARHIRSDSGTA